jgi:hypothetical protein
VTEFQRKKGAERTTVRLPEALHTRAKVGAARLRLSLQDFVAAAVEARLGELERKGTSKK